MKVVIATLSQLKKKLTSVGCSQGRIWDKVNGPYTLHVCDYSQSCSRDQFSGDRALCVLLIGRRALVRRWLDSIFCSQYIHNFWFRLSPKRRFWSSLSPFTVAGQKVKCVWFFFLFSGSTGCRTFLWEPALGCGLQSCASSLLQLMQAP